MDRDRGIIGAGQGTIAIFRFRSSFSELSSEPVHRVPRSVESLQIGRIPAPTDPEAGPERLKPLRHVSFGAIRIEA